MNKIRIKAAITKPSGVTLYLEDGTTMELPSDNWKTKALMDKAMKPLARHQTVEIDLDEFSMEAKIEQKTGGLIRFIRKKVAGLFGLSSKTTSTADPAPAVVPLAVVVQSEAVEEASDEPEAAAPRPIDAEPDIDEGEMVAIVQTPDGPARIPHVDKLDRVITNAALTDNTAGLERFLARLAPVMQKRSHTVKELMNFMERGDLPIADDGSIIGYKVLKTENGRPGDQFVDCHSGKVTQRLGSLVMQDEGLIDQDRRNECSTGLHIARRGYLRQFTGNIITMVKVAPEDVVAVPNYDANKMRAASYHIVAVLPPEVHSVLRNNQPMTSNETAARILADVIAGRHVGVLERVRIGAAKGGNITIEKVEGVDEAAPIETGNVFAKALDDGALLTVGVQDARDAINAAIAETKVVAERVEEALEENDEDKDDADMFDARDERFEETPETSVESEPVEAPVPVVEATPAPAVVEQEPVETKAQRDARRKREKRAEQTKARADRIEAQAIQEVAARPARQKAPSVSAHQTGTPRAETLKPARKPSATPAASAPKALSDRDEQALALHKAGKSLREIERELKMCRKRLGRLIKGN